MKCRDAGKDRDTILIVGVTLIVGTILCSMAAYGSHGLSPEESLLLLHLIATMLIPEVVTARPLYEFYEDSGIV